MKISEIIRSYRKKENLTQEQVANYLNISAPAVNKWENGISYPDITLLAPLARILKIDVNTLLAFNEELTIEEVNKFVKEVAEIASKEGYQKAFEQGSDLIKKYLKCDELILRIASILRLFLASSEAEEKEKYERKIIAWLELVATSSEEKVKSQAKLLLSIIYREKKEYEKAQKLLNETQVISLDKKIQQVLLFESSEKFNEAYCVCEDILFENAHESLGALFLIIELLLKEDKFNEAEKYVEMTKNVIEIFKLGAYYKYTLDLYLTKEKQDKEKAIEVIINMVNEAESMGHAMKSKLYKHRKWNITSSWSKEKYERIAKERIKKDKTLDFIKSDSRIKFLLEQY